MRYSFAKLIHGMTICLALTFMSCNQTLYTNLDEKEANEMMVVLMQKGIACEKSYADRGDRVNILVDPNDIPHAVNILREHGYPKEQFTNLGEVFTKNSLVSSPTEEHARYIFALSQDLSKTLSELDGVIIAKVHFVMPQNKPKKGEALTPTAAVFIKHSPKVDMESYVPQIKLLIQGSIEGLKYDDVNVALFPAVNISSLNEKNWKVEDVFSIKVLESSKSRMWIVMGIFIFTIVVMLAVCLFLITKNNSNIQNSLSMAGRAKE